MLQSCLIREQSQEKLQGEVPRCRMMYATRTDRADVVHRSANLIRINGTGEYWFIQLKMASNKSFLDGAN